jgi:hypothetical protein
MFLIQRSFILAVFIPHEDFTPHKYVHSSMWGVQRGGTPSAGSKGKRSPGGGSREVSPDGGMGVKPPRKNFLVNVYCNFIVNLDRSL